MERDLSSALQSIDAAVLAPVVQLALQRGRIRLQDWSIAQLGGGAGNPVSVGLYRLAGTALDGSQPVPWSLVLKIIQSPANVGMPDLGGSPDTTHWNYWQREPHLYLSDLLNHLPAGLAAPRCYGVRDLPGDFTWLWLEDITDDYPGPWPLERYALTARHLGRLNAAFPASQPLPLYPWLSFYTTRQWVASMDHWRTIPWDHPLLLAHYPPPSENPFRALLRGRERVLAALDQVPKALAHGDTYPTNFKSRRMNGQDQTVALDWALAGISPLGDDLGQLVLGATLNLPHLDPAEIDRALFAAYLSGLDDEGCRIDPAWVRFGYVTTAALRIGLFQLFLFDQELQTGHPAIPAQPAQDPSTNFVVRKSAESFDLLATL